MIYCKCERTRDHYTAKLPSFCNYIYFVNAGEGAALESTAGGGEAITRQDPVREDGDHQEPAAVARPGKHHREQLDYNELL